MIVFFVLYTAVEAIKLTEYEQFSLDLEPNSSEYFMFKGDVDYAYMFQKEQEFQFWLLRNNSHRLYSTSYSNNLKFDWPDFKINGEDMDLILSEGELREPYNFNHEVFLTTVYSIHANNFEYVIAPVYKCIDYTNWFIFSGIVLILAVLIIFNHESITTILRPLIPWIIWWTRTVLSSSEEEISSNEEGN